MTKQRIKLGALVEIDLQACNLGFGRILEKSQIAFYDYNSDSNKPSDLNKIYNSPVIFITSVMSYAVKSGRWKIIDEKPLEHDLLKSREYFIKDMINGSYQIYQSHTGEMRPATRNECLDLECAAAWEPDHIEERLRDYFAGRQNKWLESLKP